MTIPRHDIDLPPAKRNNIITMVARGKLVTEQRTRECAQQVHRRYEWRTRECAQQVHRYEPPVGHHRAPDQAGPYRHREFIRVLDRGAIGSYRYAPYEPRPAVVRTAELPPNVVRIGDVEVRIDP